MIRSYVLRLMTQQANLPDVTKGFLLDLDVLNRLLREQDLTLSGIDWETSLERGSDNVVEKEGSIDEKTEADYL